MDTTESLKRMSWGMRIASFLGAVALSAAVFLFLQRIWGTIGAMPQVAILAGAPLLLLAATEYAARKERTLYFAGLLALVSLACFVVDLSLLGWTFNMTPTHAAFLAWGAFSLILAYAYGLRLLLGAGLLFLTVYVSASTASWLGADWTTFGERPENFLLPGALALAVGALSRDRRSDFPDVYRFVGLLALLLPIFALSCSGEWSYIALDRRTVQILYQLLGFGISGVGVWIGVRSGWADVTNLSATFFVLLLLVKFYDWWWELLPRYLFFTIVGLAALALLGILRRLRRIAPRVAA